MSSVKRRKVDDDVPSGLLKKKTNKHVRKESPQGSASPEPILKKAPGPEAQEEAPTKTFKDLVCIAYFEYLWTLTNVIRGSLIRYATPVLLWDTKRPHQSKLNRYHWHCKVEI